MIDKLESIDKELGIKVYKDGRGLFKRYPSDLKMWLAKRDSPYELDEDVKRSVENGAYFFENLYRDETIERVRDEMDVLLNSDDVLVKEVNGVEVMRANSFDPSSIEGMDEILGNQELVEKVRAYLGSDFKLGISKVLHYKHIPEEEDITAVEKSTRAWHLDTSPDPNSVRFLVFLTDQVERGAFEVVSSEQTSELLDKFDFDDLANNPAKVEENADIKYYSGKKGSALLSNVLKQLHRRGSDPAEGEVRTVLIFSFLPK